MHPAGGNGFLSFRAEPPVNQCFGSFRILGVLEDTDWRIDDDTAFFRIAYSQRFFLGFLQFQDVFFQNNGSHVFAGQQFVLDSGVAFFHTQTVGFQFLEIIPAESGIESHGANHYISRTGQHWVRHSDLAFIFRFGQIFPAGGDIFFGQFILVVSNDHIVNTDRQPGAVRIACQHNVFKLRRFVVHQQALFLQRQVVRGVGNHQHVRANLFRFDFAGNLGFQFFRAVLEPGYFQVGESFGNVRFAELVHDIRIDGSVNAYFS